MYDRISDEVSDQAVGEILRALRDTFGEVDPQEGPNVLQSRLEDIATRDRKYKKSMGLGEEKPEGIKGALLLNHQKDMRAVLTAKPGGISKGTADMIIRVFLNAPDFPTPSG